MAKDLFDYVRIVKDDGSTVTAADWLADPSLIDQVKERLTSLEAESEDERRAKLARMFGNGCIRES